MSNTTSLQAIPPPGIAINPAYIASQPETLVLKGGLIGTHFTVTDRTGTEILKLDGERFSMSHRTQVTEVATGTTLCTLRREAFKMKAHYYAEVGEGGPRLFDLESKSLVGGEKFVIRFPNAAGGGANAELDWKGPAFSSRGEIYLNGMLVALCEKEHMKMKGEFQIHVAPGIDRLLAVCILVCVIDRRNNNNTTASSGAAASAS